MERTIEDEEVYMNWFGDSHKTVSTTRNDGKETRTKEYTNGRLESIQDTVNETGETHHHEVRRNIFGPYAGPKK